MRQVDHLLPGVTTVTPHARYYSLHPYVATQVEHQGLTAEQASDLLRRCEVTLAAVSSSHHDPHPGMPRAHGADKVATYVREGEVDIDHLSKKGVYAQGEWGFRGPYLGSEMLLGLLRTPRGSIQPGPAADRDALVQGFEGLYELSRQRTVDVQSLRAHEHLCLCRAASSADGEMLRRLLLAKDAESESHADHRRQTIRMLLRLVELPPRQEGSREPWAKLAFGPAGHADPILASLDAALAWRGVILRSRYVNAWRQLWSWMADQITGLTHRTVVETALADTVPHGTVKAFRRGLPLSFDIAGDPAPAELDPAITSLSRGLRELSLLAVSAGRSGDLDDRVAVYFEGPQERNQELTPSWLRAQLDQWDDRPMPDFTRHLTRVVVSRSQRVALAKSRYNRATGIIDIPTRVYLRDDYIFKDSREGGGEIGVRWQQLSTVLAGLGLLEWNEQDESWELTEAGREARG